jgi:tetratricopeptide (TPR) repeat protein
VTISDLHDAAFYAWRDAGVRDAVLVHVDAHHDADAKEWPFVTISNFVWWALSEGLLREVYWIVPDPSWETTSGRALIERSIVTLARQHDPAAALHSHGACLRTTIAGKPFIACPLRALPPMEHALVDIDVDYFLVPDIAHELPPIDGAVPWIWPADLVDALRTATPAMVTVATSTRGGFTPLEWKYLGEELCARLSESPLEGFDVLRAGAEAEHRGDGAAAEAAYRRAIRMLPASAGARYRLARLCLMRGDVAQARTAFAGALEHDPSYRAIDSSGRRWHAAGQPVAAARGYRDVLLMDPDNPYAELGLGQLAAHRGDHLNAIPYFDRALRSCGTLVDAHRGLARSLEATGQAGRAIEHYERSIQLELRGHASIEAPIATQLPRIFDDAHWETHRRLAALQHDTRWLEALDRVRAPAV